MKEAPRRWLLSTMLAGLVALLPLYLTFWALYLLFLWVDGFLSPVFSPLIARLLNAVAGIALPPGVRLPGVGLLSTFTIILLAGILARNVVSRRIVRALGRWLEKIPLFGVVLSAAKEFLGLFMKKRAFSSVAAVEYPLRGTWTLGFVTGRLLPGKSPAVQRPMTCFFVSTTPNPTTGFLLLVPPEEVVALPMSVEEGIRTIVSAGIITGGRIPPEGSA